MFNIEYRRNVMLAFRQGIFIAAAAMLLGTFFVWLNENGKVNSDNADNVSAFRKYFPKAAIAPHDTLSLPRSDGQWHRP